MKVSPKGALLLTRSRSDDPDSSRVEGATVMDMKTEKWSSSVLIPSA